jgi:hypothetical protein
LNFNTSGSDDEYHALNRFFELLEEFIELKQKDEVSNVKEAE